MKIGDGIPLTGQAIQPPTYPGQSGRKMVEVPRTGIACPRFGLFSWYGKEVILIDIETFGESAPGKVAAAHFGLTPEAVYKAIQSKL